MKDLVSLNLDPDRLTFVAGPASFDEALDLEDDFAGLIGIGFEDVFDTPEHNHEPAQQTPPNRQKSRPNLTVVK